MIYAWRQLQCLFRRRLLHLLRDLFDLEKPVPGLNLIPRGYGYRALPRSPGLVVHPTKLYRVLVRMSAKVVDRVQGCRNVLLQVFFGLLPLQVARALVVVHDPRHLEVLVSEVGVARRALKVKLLLDTHALSTWLRQVMKAGRCDVTDLGREIDLAAFQVLLELSVYGASELRRSVGRLLDTVEVLPRPLALAVDEGLNLRR